MRPILSIISACILSTSCSVQGLTDDYKKLNVAQREIVKVYTPLEAESRKIYKINGTQLLDEVKRHPKALVYVFVNGCRSEHCKPMFIYENFARKNDYKLFLVMSGFASLEDTMNQPFESPLYAIDAQHYNTIYRGKYTRYFYNELAGKPKGDIDWTTESLFFFENGKLVQRSDTLPR